MKTHKHNRGTDQDHVKQLDQFEHFVMKYIFIRNIGPGPLQYPLHFQFFKTLQIISGHQLRFGAVGMNSPASKLCRSTGVTFLDAALVAAGFDAV